MRRMILAIVLIFSLAKISAAEKPRLPNTPAAHRCGAMLTAFNSGDAAEIRSFIADNYADEALKQRSAEARAGTYLQLYSDTSGFELRRIEQSSDTSITVLTETRALHEWYRITCLVEPDKQHRMLGAVFSLTARPAEFADKGKLTDAQIAASVSQYAAKLSDRGLFGGVVLFARGDKPALEKAFAWRNNGRTEQYDVSDRFGLASINKMFTAVAVLQLVDAGKLALTDTLAARLPDFPAERGATITIHQLLTHTAGLEPLLDEAAFADMRKAVRTRSDQARFLGSRPAVAAPGEAFHYSNAGYMLLDAVVERITGEGVQQYLAARVFAPAGMAHTLNGGSTASDLLRFSSALTSGKLLSKQSLAEMMKPQVQSDDPDVGYGYAMEIRKVNGTRIVGHAGGGQNISTQLDIYPDEGCTVAVLSHRQGNTAERVANRLRELITQK